LFARVFFAKPVSTFARHALGRTDESNSPNREEKMNWFKRIKSGYLDDLDWIEMCAKTFFDILQEKPDANELTGIVRLFGKSALGFH